jgi:DNA-directed RNA polymerase beta subunit
MNIGQVLEIHLGLGRSWLGKQLEEHMENWNAEQARKDREAVYGLQILNFQKS